MTARMTVTEENPNAARLLDVSEARRRLNVGLTKFYELVNQGDLRTVTIGRRRLVSEDAITEFITRLEATASLPNQATREHPRRGGRVTKEEKRTRSANGEGSIYQDANGGWHAWVTMGVKNDGSPDRRHRRGTTRQEVAAKVAELERERDAGTVTTAGERLTVAQWLAYWLDNIAAAKVTEGTMSGYRPLVRRHLIPGLGKHRLDRLQPEHVEAFYRELTTKGMAPATILKISPHSVPSAQGRRTARQGET